MDSFGNRSPVLRVPMVNNSILVHPCAFEYILPDLFNCPQPGIWVDLLLLIVQLLKAEPRMKLIPATRNDFGDRTPNDSSVLGMLLNGEVDISPPFMSLTYSRARYLRYTTPYREVPLAYIYKAQDASRPQLNLYKLYPLPFVLFGSIWVCLFLLRLWVNLLIKRAKSAAAVSCWPDFYGRSDLVLGLALAVLLGCISSHVVMVFNMPPKLAKKPITNLEDLTTALESLEFTAVAKGQMYIDEILNPLEHAGKAKVFDRLIAAAKRNPPLLVSTIAEIMALVLNGTTKYVGVIDALYLDTLHLHYCGYERVADPSFRFAPYTVYLGTNWNFAKELDQLHINTIKKEYQFLRQKYGIGEGKCQTSDTVVTDYSDLSISLSQIMGAFWSLAFAAAGAVLVMMIEFAFGKLHKLLASVAPIPNDDANTESTSRATKRQKERTDHCVCRKCRGLPVASTDRTILCSSCGRSLLAACLSICDGTYDFIKNSSISLIVCDICKSEGVGIGQAAPGQGSRTNLRRQSV